MSDDDVWWHRIAISLGGRTVEEWQDIMSAEEFRNWQLYYKVEPFGPWIERYMVAMQTARLINATLRVSNHHALKPSDFMPHFQ